MRIYIYIYTYSIIIKVHPLRPHHYAVLPLAQARDRARRRETCSARRENLKP